MLSALLYYKWSIWLICQKSIFFLRLTLMIETGRYFGTIKVIQPSGPAITNLSNATIFFHWGLFFCTITCITKSLWPQIAFLSYSVLIPDSYFILTGNYSCLKVELMFTRDRVFYFTTVFIPGIILVTSSFITFWLEWNAVPARVMIGKWSFYKINIIE